MAYIKDTGTPGANNAELPIGAILDTGAKTLSLEVGTDVQSAVVLEEKQWIVLETRNINGTANLIGECIYSEDAADLSNVLTFINDVRTRMIALHTTFDISATHYLMGNVVNIFRGDEATAATLEAADTDVTLTPPALWGIDDLTPFAPPVVEASTNIVVDSGYDNGSNHSPSGGASISGSKLHFDGSDSTGCYSDINEALIEGASYKISIDCEARSQGYYRFYMGSQVSSYSSMVGTFTDTIVCPSGASTLRVTSMNNCIGTFDNFTCERV